MDQFAQMKTMLSSFLGPRQETTRTALYNYLASEFQTLEERDIQTSRNETQKHFSGTQRKGPVSPSTLHFLGALVPRLNSCHRLFNSHSNRHQLVGNTY